MIELRSVSYHFTPGQPLFEGLSWKVARGEAWAVLGPSGCGKTTLLYLLAGLRTPTAGEVLVDGSRLERPRPHTGLILQEYGLLPWATVRGNAALGQRIRTFYGPDGKHAPREGVSEQSTQFWLDRLGLQPVAEKYPAQLSGGQRQRTAIARTLALQPDLLLMDEPFSSLDAPTRESLQNLTLELQAEQRLTLVIVTHSIEEAAILGRKILLLGTPPTQTPTILTNPQAGSSGFRNSQAYFHLCQALREKMDIMV